MITTRMHYYEKAGVWFFSGPEWIARHRFKLNNVDWPNMVQHTNWFALELWIGRSYAND